MTTYKIIRFRFEGNDRTIKRGLTLKRLKSIAETRKHPVALAQT